MKNCPTHLHFSNLAFLIIAFNGYSVIGHEIKEQQSGQLEGKLYDDAHKDGMKAEKQVTGFTRAGMANTTTGSEVNGVFTGRYDVVYITGNNAERMIEASVHVTRNNVTVTRKNVD